MYFYADRQVVVTGIVSRFHHVLESISAQIIIKILALETKNWVILWDNFLKIILMSNRIVI